MSKNNDILDIQRIYEDIKSKIYEARKQIYKHIDNTAVEVYWYIGRIVNEILDGNTRAEYGKAVIDTLSKKLMDEFGSGFDSTNIRKMRRFYDYFPIWDAVRPELSWTHYRDLIKIERNAERGFSYVGNQQKLKIGEEYYFPDLIFYNRLAKCFVIIDLKIGKLTHGDIGQMQMYVNYYKETQMIEGENEPIGILLCASKDDVMVKTTLGNNKNIYASRYLTYLPTEDELIRVIENEKERIENIKNDNEDNV